jgi:hypothetical protein
MSCILCIEMLWWGYNSLKKRQAEMEEFTTNLSNTIFFMKDRIFLAQWVTLYLHRCLENDY